MRFGKDKKVRKRQGKEAEPCPNVHSLEETLEMILRGKITGNGPLVSQYLEDPAAARAGTVMTRLLSFQGGDPVTLPSHMTPLLP